MQLQELPISMKSDTWATRPAAFRGASDAGAHHAEYVAFEDVFYDHRVIEAKMNLYLPYITGALKRTVATDLVADLGCGRGELLGLLKREGIKALGVEINVAEAATLAAEGLDVRHTDANSFLEGCEDGSLAAAIAIQVVEHLEPDYFQRMAGLLGAKVAEGGIVVFETPNPKCLSVHGTFYLDLTHQRPYPIETVKFYLERAGFVAFEQVYLLPCDEAYRVLGMPESNYTDYALIARR